MPVTLESFDRDYPTGELLGLWRESIPNLDARRVQWSYRGNPSGSAKVFLLRDDERNAAVGSVTLFPKLYSWQGADLLGGTTGDFSVAKEQRALGPALRLQKAAAASDDFGILLGFANDKAAAIQLLSGFAPLCPLDRFYLVFRSRRILKRQFPGTPLWLAAPVLDCFGRLLRCRRRLARRRRRELGTVEQLDGRVDGLWNQMRKRFDLVGRRDEAHLRWRYQQSPYKPYAFYGLEELASGELLGLLAYRVDDDGIAWIDDFVFADADAFFGAVLPAFVAWGERAGLDAVSLKLARSTELAERLARAGFRRKETGETLLWRHRGDLAIDPERWNVCITAGDDDM